jgi:predicted dehydrogenase
MTGSDQPLRVGVVGLGRGRSFMQQAAQSGFRLVALCDTREEELRAVGGELGVATYTDFEAFLGAGLDAVVLANYFHEHAPLAIRALRAGKHVLSECTACKTLAEGVALCRAVEESGATYMLAENYPYTAFNQELWRLYQAGEIGQVMYAEGEYNHPMSLDDHLRISPGLRHWRNNLAATYYCTHALAPLMTITETMPVAVNVLAIPLPAELRVQRVQRQDAGAVILCRMDNGAVFRLFGVGVPGHSNWYRLHGARGLLELVRGPGYWGREEVRVMHDPWDLRDGEERERVYKPDFPAWARGALAAGHGGGDFFTTHYFGEAIRTRTAPFLNVYRAVAMSAVGILGWKSALQGGAPFAVPDFADADARRAVADDHWSPFPEDAGPGQPLPSIEGDYTPTEAAIAHARQVWGERER